MVESQYLAKVPLHLRHLALRYHHCWYRGSETYFYARSLLNGDALVISWGGEDAYVELTESSKLIEMIVFSVIDRDREERVLGNWGKRKEFTLEVQHRLAST